MLENVYEGLNAWKCIWRLKCSTQSVFIERVFLRNVPDLRVYFFWNGFSFLRSFLCFVCFAKLSVWVGGWRKCNSSEAIYFAIHQLLKATQSIESIYFTHPPFGPLNLRVAGNFSIYFINNIFKPKYCR